MGIRQVASKVFRTRLASSQSKNLFSFATKHNLFDKTGAFNKEGIVLVHLTDFAPTDGIIQSARNAIGYTRDSVHFSINHSVVSHSMGDWASKKYAIILPFEKTIKTKGNKIVGGFPADLYSKGSIRIPKGSVIVRYNSEIPKGKYRILDSSKICEFKKLKGIKIVESSDANMQNVADNVITKLGYDLKSTEEFLIWGSKYGKNNGYLMLDKFNKFLKHHKMKPMLHTYTPNARIERLCENLCFRAEHCNSWLVKGKDGKIILDYKEKYIEILENIIQDAKKYNKTDYDINKLIEIVKQSKTPLEAEKSILECLNLKTLTTEGDWIINEYTIYQHLSVADIDRNVIEKLEEYIKKPNINSLNQVENLANNNVLRYWSTQHLFEIGADKAMAKVKDNEIANKLYRLVN